MFIQSGEKVHVITRRRFEADLRRHFVGEIQEIAATAARIDGYVFVLDTATNQFVRKPEKRTTLMDLAESGYIVNIIPEEVLLEDLRYVITEQKKLIVTDGRRFSLDINEFGYNR